MSIVQREVVIVSYPERCKDTIVNWISALDNANHRGLFHFLGRDNLNGNEELILKSTGSKVGWSDYDNHKELREKFIAFLESQKYDDGSNSIHYVEVGYGDVSQAVLGGNSGNEQPQFYEI